MRTGHSRARRIGSTATRCYLGIRVQRFIARRLAPADMLERWSNDRIVDPYGPGLRPYQADDQIGGGGLAGTGSPDQRDTVASRN